MKKTLLLILLSLSVPAANASIFDFSYTTSYLSGILGGQLEGTMQGDNNTVVVTKILDFTTYNGVQISSLPYIYSTDTFNFGTAGLLPQLTLDGSFMDLFACSNTTCSNSDAFTFNAGNNTALNYGTNSAPFYASDGVLGGYAINFNAANWHLTAVPLPSALPLFAIGWTMLGWHRRRVV
jgi:hypothetical protein